MNRLDAVERVSAQDTRVLSEVKSFRTQVRQRGVRLKRAKAEQVQVVADRAAQRQSIEGQLAERNRLLSSIKDQIASLEAAERLRQARLAAEARARLSRATLQAQDQSVQASDALLVTSSPAEVLAPAPPVSLRRRGRDRDAVPRRSLRLGRREPVRLRLLRFHHVRLRPDGRVAAAPRCVAVRLGLTRLARRARGRRPRLLQRARPRRYLHRRRPVHPRAAHRRRRQDLEPLRLLVRGDLRRRDVGSRSRRPGSASRRRRAPRAPRRSAS